MKSQYRSTFIFNYFIIQNCNIFDQMYKKTEQEKTLILMPKRAHNLTVTIIYILRLRKRKTKELLCLWTVTLHVHMLLAIFTNFHI